MASQNERILAHLTTGRSITPLEAMGVFGCYRLGARIFELKKKGHNITMELCHDPNGKPYAKYRLVTRDRFGRRKVA